MIRLNPSYPDAVVIPAQIDLLLLEIIAKEVNMVPDELIGNLGDVHLYSNHVEQAKEQIGRELTIEERRVLCFTQ